MKDDISPNQHYAILLYRKLKQDELLKEHNVGIFTGGLPRNDIKIVVPATENSPRCEVIVQVRLGVFVTTNGLDWMDSQVRTRIEKHNKTIESYMIL